MIRSAGRPSWPNATTTVPEAICWSGLASARSSVSASTHSFTATAHYTSAVAVLTSCSSLRSAEGAAAFGCRLPGDVAVRKQRRSQQRAGTESSTYHLARTRTRARHPSTSSPALSFMDPVTRSLNADASSQVRVSWPWQSPVSASSKVDITRRLPSHNYPRPRRLAAFTFCGPV